MRLFLAALLLCLAVPTLVEARPSPYRADAFSGDRYVTLSQGNTSARDVVDSVRCPPPACQRSHAKGKGRYLYRTKRPPPAFRSRRIAPLTLAGGLGREGRRALTQIVGGRPSGCPSRFCGCGASLHLFGRIIPRLNLAANWLAFPRTSPAPNMVAARRGHVFVLKRHIAGSVWLAYDANSGGRRIRIHPRSIAGFVIVNPHGRA